MSEGAVGADPDEVGSVRLPDRPQHVRLATGEQLGEGVPLTRVAHPGADTGERADRQPGLLGFGRPEVDEALT